MISADAQIYRRGNRKVILGPAGYTRSARPAGKNTLWLLECIHGILTPCASSYVARLILPVFSHMGVWVALLTLNYHMQFERGGVTKPIIGSSWNNNVKNCLDSYQVQKRPNLIMLIVFVDYEVCKRLSNSAWSIPQYFFDDTHTHTHTHTRTKALLYPVRVG